MYWLCLYFPDLVWTLCFPEMAEYGLAALSVSGRIFAATRAAHERGIVAGLSLEAAVSLLPGLQIRVHDPELESRWLRRKADEALSWTPRVCCEQSALLLEIQGSEHLFQGRRHLVDQIVCALAGEQACQVAGAPTQEGALCLARAGVGVCVEGVEFRRALADLSLAMLPLPETEQTGLSMLGLRQIRDAWRLPRPGLRYRFPALTQLVERALGQAVETRVTYKPTTRFEYHVDPEWPLATQEQVMHELRILLDRLEQALRGRVLQVHILSLSLHVRHHEYPLQFRVESMQPQARAAFWERLWRERLRSLVLADPIDRLVLLVEDPGVIAGDSRHLFSGQDQSLPLADILRARLPHAVHGLRCVPDHRPERAWGYDGPPARDVRLSGEGHRPLWLLSRPVSLTLHDCRPCHEGRPLQLCSGPERIESGWWDGADISRDYFIAEDAAGGVLWVFRECDRRRWFLHGIFA